MVNLNPIPTYGTNRGTFEIGRRLEKNYSKQLKLAKRKARAEKHKEIGILRYKDGNRLGLRRRLFYLSTLPPENLKLIRLLESWGIE